MDSTWLRFDEVVYIWNLDRIGVWRVIGSSLNEKPQNIYLLFNLTIMAMTSTELTKVINKLENQNSRIIRLESFTKD